MSNGIMISQEGIDVERAADYQKVLDSRWRFMEVEREIEINVTLPALSTTVNTPQRVEIWKHNLGFTPAFHGSYLPIGAYDPNFDPNYSNAGIYANNEMIYFRRDAFANQPVTAIEVKVKVIVYNLPILEPYEAPLEATSNVGRVESEIGVRALDGSDSAIDIDDSSSYGFSVDTKKKVLSINKIGQKWINSSVNDGGRATAVDPATDIFTYTNDTNPGSPDNTGTSWIQTGVPLTMFPADFTTMPGPLTQGTTYYIIRLNDTQFKLALSQSNALAGIAIDITSAGSLPLSLRRGMVVDDYRVAHGAAYPPSFFFCETINEFNFGRSVESLRHVSTTPLISADTNYLYFNGVQAVYAGYIAYIILKDPMELAQ